MTDENKLFKDVKSASKIWEWKKLNKELYNKMNDVEDSYDDILKELQKHNLKEDDILINTNKVFYFAFAKRGNYTYVEIPFLRKDIFDFIRLDEKLNFVKQKQEEALNKKEYFVFLSLIPDAFIVSEFEKLIKKIDKDYVWELFKYVYTKTEFSLNAWDKDVLYKILKDRKEKRKKTDKEFFIYRGEGSLSTNYKDGAISWTKNVYIAKRFISKDTKDRNTVIYKAKINDKDVIDYINDLNEEEVLVFGKDIKNVEIVE